MTEPIHYSFKIVLLGEHKVGKSHIWSRFATNEFEAHMPPTQEPRPAKRVVALDAGGVELEVWDSPGTLKQKPVFWANLLNDAHGAVIVYDLTDRGSFRASREWLAVLEKYGGPKLKTLMLGNKLDDGAQDRAVQTAFARKTAVKHGMRFLEASAKTAFNVDAAFLELARACKEGLLGQTRVPERIVLSKTVYDLVKANDLVGLRRFIKENPGVDVNLYKNHIGRVSLQQAAFAGNTEAAQVLLENNARVNQQDNEGWTSLHQACWEGHIDIVVLLVERKANVDMHNSYGQTGLQMAAFHGFVGILDVLLDAKAEVGHKNKFGSTALHFAAGNGKVNCVRLLAVKGLAQLDARNNDGETARDVAQSESHSEVTTFFDVELPQLLHEEQEKRYSALQGQDVVTDPSNVRLVVGKNLYDLAASGYLDGLRKVLRENPDADVNAFKNHHGRTALQQACYQGHVEIARELLLRKAKVNKQDDDGWTALHHCAWNGHTDVARLLLQSRARVDTTTADGNSALHKAAFHGHEDLVQLLIENGARVNVQNADGSTPMHFAASSGEVGCIRQLLRGGAAADLADKDGETPRRLAELQNAVQVVAFFDALDRNDGAVPDDEAKTRGDSSSSRETKQADVPPERMVYDLTQTNDTHSLKRFLRAHPDVNVDGFRNPEGRTALMQAASHGTLELTSALLDRKARPNAPDGEGWSAVHQAAWKGHVRIVKLLLEHKGSVGQATLHGNTALHKAAYRGHKHVTRALLNANADANARNDAGQTALHLAAAHGDPDGLRLLLLCSNVDIHGHDNEGLTAFEIAQAEDSVRAVEFFESELDRLIPWQSQKRTRATRANIDVPDWTGYTGLMRAAYYGDDAAVAVLLEHKANVHVRNEYGGLSALHYAASRGHSGVCRQLLERKAYVDQATSSSATAAHLAAQHGHVKVLQELVWNHKARTDVVNKFQQTPKDVAESNGHVSCVRFLESSQ